MGPTPFLNDALVRSALTRKIAALETSTRRNPSQSQVNQLNDLKRTYHGILTPSMKPETALGVLSKLAQPSPGQLTQAGDNSPHRGLTLQNAMEQQQRRIQTLSNVMKTMHDTSKSIIQNLK
jgi:hypothetical protein